MSQSIVAPKISKYPQTGTFLLTPSEPGLPPFALRKEIHLLPTSFAYMYKEKPFKGLVQPIYMGPDRYERQPPSTKQEMFVDVQRQENGELKLVNKDIIDSQSGIFGEVIKKALAAFFSGQGLVGMSLPVRIFEPRSTLQRIADNMCYIPNIMKRANDATDPLERAKLCLTSLLSGICMSPSMRKPFNPYLGETMEAEFSDGSKLYMEHTSHHPPISNFYIDTTYGAKMYGRFEQIADMGRNSMELIYRGPYNIQFSDGAKVTMFLPTGTQSGVVVGSRLLKFEKKICYIDQQNRIKGHLDIGHHPETGKYKGKRVDTFTGEIYVYDPNKHQGYGENFKKVYDAFNGKDKVQSLSKAQGSYFEAVEFDGVEYWNFDTHKIDRARPIANPLPSDYRFREDLLWLEYGDKDQAQDWKLKLEEIQRWDRGLRQEAEKKRKKAKKH